MKKEIENQIRSLARAGALRPIEGLIEELISQISPAKYENNQGQFLIDCGKVEGKREGMLLLVNEINRIAKQ